MIYSNQTVSQLTETKFTYKVKLDTSHCKTNKNDF